MNTTTLDPASAEHVATEAPTDPAADPYALAEAAVDKARAVVSQRLRERDDADAALPGLRSRLARGDDSVTASDLAAAAMIEDRAELLLKAAESSLKRTTAAGPFRPSTATLLVDAVATALAINVDDVALVDAPNAVGKVDSASLRQAAPTTAAESLTGAVACREVEVYYHRSPKFRAADWVALDDALTKAGFYAEVASRGSSERNGIVTDRAVINVRAAFPAVLVLPGKTDPSNWDSNHFVNVVLAEADHAVPPHVDLSRTGVVGRRSVRGSEVVTVVTATIKGKGGRDTTGQALPVGGVMAAIAAAPQALIGRPFSGLGHLAKVEVIPTADTTPERRGELTHRIAATFTATAA